MTIITIDSALFCQGAEVAEGVAAELGLSRFGDDDLLAAAAKASGLAEKKLRRAMCGPPSFFAGLLRDRAEHAAQVRLALARRLAGEPFVHLGLAGYLVPSSLAHVLRVGLAGNHAWQYFLEISLIDERLLVGPVANPVLEPSFAPSVLECHPNVE